MKKRLLTILAIILSGAVSLRAQNLSDLIISEVVVENETGLVDENGEHTPWLELTNTSQGTVNYAGCYLTDNKDVPKKYMIPKGVIANRLGARQVVVIRPGFEIRKGSTIYLISTDGKTVIDSIKIPSDLPADMSVRKLALDNKKMDFKTMHEPAVPSPGLMNSEGNTESGAEKVARTDPYGGVLTLTSVSVVFAALLILLIIFTIMGNVFSGKYKRKPKKSKASIDADTAAAIAMALDLECGDDGTAAAIATAIHLYLEDTVHDSESFVITITPRSSSWNNKKDMFRKLVR